MHNEQTILEVLDATAKRRAERRSFLRAAGGATAAMGGLALLSACDTGTNDATGYVGTPTSGGSGTTTTGAVDFDILNFALNLEYLEAQFYSYAVYGTGLAASLQTGTGTQGAVSTSGSNPPRAVDFTGEPLIAQYAREIAADEIAHVAFLRTAIGANAVAQPALNISGDAAGAFTTAARAAGVVGAAGTFDPYSSPDAFLIGAYIFEDVGVTAYKGAAPLLTSKTYLEAAAGILAAEAYHAGLVRTILYARGQTNASLIQNTGKISDLRDTLDGAPADDAIRGVGADDDQPITTGTAANNYVGNGNIVPANANGLAYSRTTSQVLHIVYGTATAGASSGLFFPAGTNGNIKVAA